MNPEKLDQIRAKLLAYCQSNNWAGYDPYDALNSRLFQHLPFLDFRIPRIALTQALKRSPVNLRPLLLVPKTQNPKGLALFLSALIKLDQGETLQKDLANRLMELRSPDTDYWCWGYSFPWQTRSIVVPEGTPNLVCTTFVANAMLDLHDRLGDERHLEMAISSARYIADELYWRNGGAFSCFRYPTSTSTQKIHNANFLGSALLARVYRLSGEQRLLDRALEVARYSAAQQREDGSWEYGELTTQRWIDNFHTGFNLCALDAIARYAETSEFDFHLRCGFEFYRNHFFTDNGIPKYFHDRIYPIDIHSVAQSIITLVSLADLGDDNIGLAEKVFSWAVGNLWDDRGYFYYQKHSWCTSRVPYIRWGQAWMLLALVTFKKHMTPSVTGRLTSTKKANEFLKVR